MRAVACVVSALAMSAARGETTRMMFGDSAAPASQRSFAGFEYVVPEGPGFRGWSFKDDGPTWHSTDSGSIPADTLLEHGVVVSGRSSLKVPFRDGPCVVHAWVGDWFRGWNRLQSWNNKDPDILLACGGRTIYADKMTVDSTFREWCRFDDRCVSLRAPQWERIVQPIFREFDFPAEAKDGAVTLVGNQLLLAAVAVASDAAEMKSLLAEVEAARRKMFAVRYPWRPRPDEPMPAGVDASAACVFFAKHCCDEVYPWTRPKAEEVTDAVCAFAARGEIEPFRFGVLPLRDVARLEVSVGDFVSESGAVIRVAESAEFWRERYKERGCPNQHGRIGDMALLDPVSFLFQPNAPQPAERGTPRMFVLDVTVPREAQPGFYEAPVSVAADGAVVVRAKLRLRVLPFALDEDGSAPYGFQMFYSTWPLDAPGRSEDRLWDCVETRARFLERFGFSNFFLSPLASWGTIEGPLGEGRLVQSERQRAAMLREFRAINPSGRLKFLQIFGKTLFLKCGWKGVVPMFQIRNPKIWDAAMRERWEKSLADIERIAPQFDAIFRANGFPEVRWYFNGELDNYGDDGVRENVRIAEALRRAGCVSHVTINGPVAARLCPPAFDHVWANPHTPISEEFAARVRSFGHGFGTHNSGDTRFQSGFQFWRTGSEGRYQETCFYVDFLWPYVYLPWNYNTAQAYPTRDGGLVPVLSLVNYREGRDDYLYAYTLERLAAAAPSGSPARLAAESFLARLRRKIHFDPRKYHVGTFDGVEGTMSVKTDEWNGYSLVRYRWQLATLIEKLTR